MNPLPRFSAWCLILVGAGWSGRVTGELMGAKPAEALTLSTEGLDRWSTLTEGERRAAVSRLRAMLVEEVGVLDAARFPHSAATRADFDRVAKRLFAVAWHEFNKGVVENPAHRAYWLDRYPAVCAEIRRTLHER